MYKLRPILPAKARLQIFNSLVQSHLNYCSLVWGSTCKSNIDSLFATQKKAMRAVMPGHVNYYYKDGQLPTHTKSGFTSHNVLTVHNVILKNMLIFVNNNFNFPETLPVYVKHGIAGNIPVPSTSPDNYFDWYFNYSSIPYNRSVFFKAPLLHFHIMSENAHLQNIKSQNAFKQRIKTYLLEVQGSGENDEWQSANFKLILMKGLRQSNRV